jgi:hypothetical protein
VFVNLSDVKTISAQTADAKKAATPGVAAFLMLMIQSG